MRDRDFLYPFALVQTLVPDLGSQRYNIRHRVTFTLLKKTVPSRKKIYYYTVYDQFNRRRQYSTGATTKADAMTYDVRKFSRGDLKPVLTRKIGTFAENYFYCANEIHWPCLTLYIGITIMSNKSARGSELFPPVRVNAHV
ncbi:hypothetical protein Spiaf_0730 [Spirochaeta africana DSM 8902]|uniref:Uncharacterized protein n=1 Tax=Spirochaeta africana (strain ATCC 700263 / DSM 8902 / Z-7692) TaxID=889378 RepID=H9UH35_SPIAZ|nr:hypothetical protein Spiaf_0730 [Spirochaeta africana DSM 8902]